ncbi:MAG: hypothetical protein RL247_903 [Actinomycetota bacterium]
MSAVPWLVPSIVPHGLSPELRMALGPLATVVDDPRVTDVFVLADGRVYVDTGGGSYLAEGLRIGIEESVDIARSLIECGGRHIDEAHPLVDVGVGRGMRVHAVLPPIASRGAEISIRLSRHQRPDLHSLDIGESDRLIPLLLRCVRARETLLITGATGSGKTTLLGALMAYASPMERLVVLEELAEISIDHPHVVSLECRQANTEGAGEVTLRRLVREALRMKPSRLIVGECRGAELADVVQAFHTGHRGGATTLHAQSLEDVPRRLEGIAAHAGLSRRALSAQALSAFHKVLHLEHRPGEHRTLEIGRFVENRRGQLRVEVQ